MKRTMKKNGIKIQDSRDKIQIINKNSMIITEIICKIRGFPRNKIEDNYEIPKPFNNTNPSINKSLRYKIRCVGQGTER